MAESGLAAFGRYDPKADFRAPNSPVGLSRTLQVFSYADRHAVNAVPLP